MAVSRLKVEGADDTALIDDARDPVGPPGLRQALRISARLGFDPGAGEGGVGRQVAEGPAQRQRFAQAPAAVHAETPAAFCAVEGLQLVAVPHHLCGAGQCQQVAGVKVDEQHAGAGVQLQVAQRHEEEVAGEVGHEEAAVVLDLHETRPPTAVRDVGAAGGSRRVGGDEQGVRALDEGPGVGVQRREGLGAARPQVVGIAHPGELPALDVLRAVAHRLLDLDAEAVRVQGHDVAVDPVAPAGVQLDAQKTQLRAWGQAIGQRVAWDRARVEVKPLGAGGPDEAGLTHQHGRPGSAGAVHRARKHERQLLEEALVLLGHRGSDDPLPQADHPFADAQPFMHGLFAGMEGVVVACGGGVHGRLPGWCSV